MEVTLSCSFLLIKWCCIMRKCSVLRTWVQSRVYSTFFPGHGHLRPKGVSCGWVDFVHLRLWRWVQHVLSRFIFHLLCILSLYLSTLYPISVLVVENYQVLERLIEPLTEEQLSGIQNLHHSSQQAEDALNQRMDALQQSLENTLSSNSWGPCGSDNVTNYIHVRLICTRLICWALRCCNSWPESSPYVRLHVLFLPLKITCQDSELWVLSGKRAPGGSLA